MDGKELKHLDAIREKLDNIKSKTNNTEWPGYDLCGIYKNKWFYTTFYQGKQVFSIANTAIKARKRLEHMVKDGWRYK